MSASANHDRDKLSDHEKHKKIVEKKQHRITGLEALIATHQAQTEPDTDYVRELKRKLHSAKSQLKNMRP
jgi:hypothetical protein